MPTLLRLVFEERDANFRIVPFVCGCLERNGNHVVFVFLVTQRRCLRIRIKEGKVHRKNLLHSFAFSRGNFKKDFVELE